MTILYTTNYHLPYMDALTALTDLDVITREIAETLDAAMGQAGYTPPDATTFAALAARVTAIETKVNAVPPLLRAGHTSATAQTTSSGVWTTVLLQTTTAAAGEDSHGAYSPSTGKWTCPAGWGGLVECVGEIAWGVSTAGRRYGRIVRTPSGGTLDATSPENARAQTGSPPLATGGLPLTVGSFLHRVAPGDTLEMQGMQDAGAAVGITPNQSSFSVRWLRA